jgi:hypothetical protein
MPAAKSRNTLPSTSVTVAPLADAAKIGSECAMPRGTAVSRRRMRARDAGPGIAVRMLIALMS